MLKPIERGLHTAAMLFTHRLHLTSTGLRVAACRQHRTAGRGALPDTERARVQAQRLQVQQEARVCGSRRGSTQRRRTCMIARRLAQSRQ